MGTAPSSIAANAPGRARLPSNGPSASPWQSHGSLLDATRQYILQLVGTHQGSRHRRSRSKMSSKDLHALARLSDTDFDASFDVDQYRSHAPATLSVLNNKTPDAVPARLYASLYKADGVAVTTDTQSLEREIFVSSLKRTGPIDQAQFSAMVEEMVENGDMAPIDAYDLGAYLAPFDRYCRQTPGFRFMDEPMEVDGVVLTDRQVEVRRAAGTCPTPAIYSHEKTLVDVYGRGHCQLLPTTPAMRARRKLDEYVAGNKAGEGTYGEVLICQDIKTGQVVAVKVIDKTELSQREAASVRREVQLMRLLRHENIVHVYDVIDTVSYVFIFMEYVPRGQVFQQLKWYSSQSLDACWEICRQVVSVLYYCHNSSVVHRDLKPDNILVDRLGKIRIIDFGFGNTYHPNMQMLTRCGTPHYMAPEMELGQPYTGPEVDIWSMGVTLYVLYTGRFPFVKDDGAGSSRQSRFWAGAKSKEQEDKVEFPPKTDKEFKHLIRWMLAKDPAKRATIEQIMAHPWVTKTGSFPIANPVPDRPDTVASPDPETVDELVALGIGKADIGHVLSDRSQKLNPIASLYHLFNESRQDRMAFDREVADELVRVGALVRESVEQETAPGAHVFDSGSDRLSSSDSDAYSSSGSESDVHGTEVADVGYARHAGKADDKIQGKPVPLETDQSDTTMKGISQAAFDFPPTRPSTSNGYMSSPLRDAGVATIQRPVNAHASDVLARLRLLRTAFPSTQGIQLGASPQEQTSTDATQAFNARLENQDDAIHAVDQRSASDIDEDAKPKLERAFSSGRSLRADVPHTDWPTETRTQQVPEPLFLRSFSDTSSTHSQMDRMKFMVQSSSKGGHDKQLSGAGSEPRMTVSTASYAPHSAKVGSHASDMHEAVSANRDSFQDSFADDDEDHMDSSSYDVRGRGRRAAVYIPSSQRPQVFSQTRKIDGSARSGASMTDDFRHTRYQSSSARNQVAPTLRFQPQAKGLSNVRVKSGRTLDEICSEIERVLRTSGIGRVGALRAVSGKWLTLSVCLSVRCSL
ncbi:hypothetical protein BC831DRAFT_441763 [Entophlyctis helioformis]|nr:hypothetical protein BC831DRAFT_441763 [Entophlyctis helioformis]